MSGAVAAAAAHDDDHHYSHVGNLIPTTLHEITYLFRRRGRGLVGDFL